MRHHVRAAGVLTATGLLLSLAAPVMAAADRPDDAANQAAGPTLTLRIYGAGNVDEFSDANYLNCTSPTSTPTGQLGQTCTVEYGWGWGVNLRTTPGTGYSLERWLDRPGVSGWVDCDNAQPNRDCEFTIWEDLQLNVYFQDTTAPVASIWSGPGSGSTSGRSVTFGVSSNEQFAQLRCRLDGQAETSCSNSASYSNLSGGNHTFSVRAVDPSGNAGPSASRTWTVDATSPETTIESGPGAVTASGEATFEFANSEPGNFRCSVDGAAFSWCTSPFTVSGLAEGQHDFRVEGRDQYQNVDPTPAEHTWTVDNTAPSAEMTKVGPASIVATTSLRLGWTGSDVPAGVEGYDVRYRSAKYDKDWSAYTKLTRTDGTARTFTATPGRTYCFAVRAVDTVGNLGTWSDEQCTTTPVDDRALGGKGWAKKLNAKDYLGTVKTTETKGRTLSLGGVRASQLAVVATTCPSCGKVDVYLDTWRVGRLDLASSTTRHRVVLSLPEFAHQNTGKMRVVVVSRNKPVTIDGFAIVR